MSISIWQVYLSFRAEWMDVGAWYAPLVDVLISHDFEAVDASVLIVDQNSGEVK